MTYFLPSRSIVIVTPMSLVDPSWYVSCFWASSLKFSFAPFTCRRVAPEVSTTAVESAREMGAAGGGPSRRLLVANTAATMPMPTTRVARRARFCQATTSGLAPGGGNLYVAHRQLQEFIALILIVFERKRQIQ